LKATHRKQNSKNGQPSKKGQMEIIGLVIIVILISLGILFYLQFSLNTRTTTKQEFTGAQMVTNTINTLLELNLPECGGDMNVRKLIQNCQNLNDKECKGIKACSYVNQTTKKIFGKTLEKWNKKYKLKIFTTSEELIELKHGQCPGSKDSATYSIPSEIPNSEPITVRLDVC